MRTMMTLVMLVLGCGYASAQMTMAPTTPSTGSALGATSPLGISGMSSTPPSSQAGIPLGATQLNVGGLSPSPGPLVGSGCSTVSSLSSSGMGTFDGGGLGSGMSGMGGTSGMSGTSGIAGSTGCGTASVTTSTASGLMSPGSSGASATGIGTIPLGATEIDSGGLSPMVVSPSPSSTTTTTGMTPGP